ncbi:uncharacterized protein BKCO1_3700034 [Diplodia corticola]|uniref:Uncharacterized protein n=1 Tax=Diplodia corticola TaxID=236234 RepID=A0A1J9RWC7_9PEZI|nr:uncharacterized protein BKCO1_3700034 [Diplodia corticola]OJD32679.1 hypothetical protein BKCO1_3700034 [Diplodia corticola]
MNPPARLSNEYTTPSAEPMSRTDSGFGDYQKAASRSETAADTPRDASPTANEASGGGTPSHRPSPLSHHQSAISAPTTPERPALRKRRSRPSSKHSARSSSRTSSLYPRPSLAGRVRSFPVELAMHHRSDLDSVLALHSRSCSIFNSLSAPTSAPQSPGLSSVGRPSTDMSRHSLQVDRNSLGSVAHQDPAHFYPMPSPALSNFSSFAEEDAAAEVATPAVPPPTVVHWNSPSTRRREYAEIDRSTRGFRGFMRRVTPRWLSRRPPRQAFYDGDKEDDDACSVRRYRIHVPDEDEHEAEAGDAFEEKHRPMSAPTARKARFWKSQ